MYINFLNTTMKGKLENNIYENQRDSIDFSLKLSSFSFLCELHCHENLSTYFGGIFLKKNNFYINTYKLVTLS